MNLSIENLNGYILGLPKQQRYEILKRNDVRNKYLEASSHYPFVWLVQSLESDDLVTFIDKEYLEKIIASEMAVDKINAIMTCGNIYANYILCNDIAVEFILNNSYLRTYISSLNHIFGQYVLDYAIKKKDLSLIKFLGNFNKNEQLETFANEYITKILELNANDNSFLFSLSGDVINKFIIYKSFLELFLNSSIENLNNIILHKDFVFPIFLLNNSTLINKYISIKNPNKYREAISYLYQNNIELAENVEKYRKIYIQEKLNNVNEDGCFSEEEIDDYGFEFYFYNPNRVSDYDIKQKYKDFSEKLELEMIVDTYFKDITYNFLLNLKSILDYISQVNDEVIKSSHVNLYKKIFNFHNLTIKERKELFRSFDVIFDYAKMFYEDFRECLDHSYKLMNEQTLKLDYSSNLYNEKLSKENGVDVYYLDGEDFFLYVHSTNTYRDIVDINGIHNIFLNNGNVKTMSISLIGNDNTKVFRPAMINFGFFKLEPQNIMHVYHSDSFSRGEYGTNRVKRIYTPSGFVKNTLGYNEILYSENNLKDFKPDFIVSYDEITEQEILISKFMNIPIVLINSKKYNNMKGNIEVSFYDKYIQPNETEQVKYY